MDIFGMGDQNSDSLRDRYNLLRNRHEEQDNLDILDKFTGLIKDEWTISINMGQWAVNSFLISGRYRNVHELKKERAEELEKHSRSKISVEKALKEHLGSYHRSRIAFDRTFENGERFKYSSLNIGGIGADKYGQYCVVFKRRQVERYSLLFIREDSLKYVDGNIVNIERLRQDIANRECVHLLTALKHERDIESTPDHEWSSMVCCNEDYTEAITADDILNSHIDTVRMNKEDFNSYFASLYDDFVSEISKSVSEKLVHGLSGWIYLDEILKSQDVLPTMYPQQSYRMKHIRELGHTDPLINMKYV